MKPDRHTGPTPERLARAGTDVEAFSPAESTINYLTIRMLDGSPLEKLATAGKKNAHRGITGSQYHAGARYFADAYLAGLLASGVVDTTRDRVDCEGYREITDYRLAAQTRFNRAHKAIGYVHAHVLDDVVLSECSLTIYANRFREFTLHRDRYTAAMTALRLALDALDIHYNGSRSAGSRYSHKHDYRPSIMTLEEAKNGS